MISCIILAGGKGSRMGYKNKALLKKNGKTFIEILLEKIKKIDLIDEIIISSNFNELDFLNIKIYPDEIKDIGPIGGLYTTLTKIKNNYALILPCDIPYISYEIIYTLVNKFNKKSDITLTKIENDIDYLIGIYSVNTLKIITKMIESKNYKIADIGNSSTVSYIAFSKKNSEYLKNINTKEDLNKII